MTRDTPPDADADQSTIHKAAAVLIRCADDIGCYLTTNAAADYISALKITGWLADDATRRHIAVQALREAAAATEVQMTAAWLMERADQLERGEEPHLTEPRVGRHARPHR